MFCQLMISGFGKGFKCSTIWRSCQGLRRWISCVRTGGHTGQSLPGTFGGLWRPKERLRVLPRLLLVLVFHRCSSKRSSNNISSRPNFWIPSIAFLTLEPVRGGNDCHWRCECLIFVTIR